MARRRAGRAAIPGCRSPPTAATSRSSPGPRISFQATATAAPTCSSRPPARHHRTGQRRAGRGRGRRAERLRAGAGDLGRRALRRLPVLRDRPRRARHQRPGRHLRPRPLSGPEGRDGRKGWGGRRCGAGSGERSRWRRPWPPCRPGRRDDGAGERRGRGPPSLRGQLRLRTGDSLGGRPLRRLRVARRAAGVGRHQPELRRLRPGPPPRHHRARQRRAGRHTRRPEQRWLPGDLGGRPLRRLLLQGLEPRAERHQPPVGHLPARPTGRHERPRRRGTGRDPDRQQRRR